MKDKAMGLVGLLVLLGVLNGLAYVFDWGMFFW
jgi:hypothetical protein